MKWIVEPYWAIRHWFSKRKHPALHEMYCVCSVWDDDDDDQ